MRFSSWPFLLLLLLLPLLHRWWRKRNRPASVKFPVPLPPTVGSTAPIVILTSLKYAALILGIVALARPQTSFKETERKVSGLDIMLVMDISYSMNAEDLAEKSRFDVAKDTIKQFIQGRKNDRIGFIVFSGEPLTLVPPTLDYGLLLKAITDIEVGSLKDGTAIGDGLSLAVSRLRDSKAKSRVVVLLTDGDNNVGQVDPATAGELAAGYGIRTYTIAIGKKGRVKLPIRTRGVFGNVVTRYQWLDNALNPELLEHIAKITHGKFYRVTDAAALDSVFKEIDQLEKTEISSIERVRYEEVYSTPLKLALLLLVLERLLALGWWRFVV